MSPARGASAQTLPTAVRSDDELMAAVAAGSGAALAELVARHRDRLVRFAGRALGDRSRGEDVAQETFLRVYRGAPSYEGRGQFTAWLITIASRLCLNLARDGRRRPEVPLEEARGLVPAATAERAVLSRELAAALARLKPRYRLALVLKAVEGRSYHEIAQMLECSEQDVANAVFRARKVLARALGASARA